jgi:hypothetical protein
MATLLQCIAVENQSSGSLYLNTGSCITLFFVDLVVAKFDFVALRFNFTYAVSFPLPPQHSLKVPVFH